MKKIERNGYGSSFNDLFYSDTVLEKVAKNTYGKKKIEHEKAFFDFLADHSITFPVPKILSYSDSGYMMIYYKDWHLISSIFPSSSQQEQRILLQAIHSSLESLHASYRKIITREQLLNDLQYEMVEKLYERNKEVKPLLDSYSFLTTVNSIQLESFETLVGFLQEQLGDYLQKTNDCVYTPIHGDCQFNNILLSPDKTSLIFLDPRGYFGTSRVLGLPEYDFAKVQFALSGYDTFDSITIESLDISGTNLSLPEICLDASVLENRSFVTVLLVSIWLANPHSFKDTPLKAVCSSFYARYYGSLVYRHFKSGMK